MSEILHEDAALSDQPAESPVPIPPLFGSWLGRTRLLQAISFGTDPFDLDAGERADFISWNFTALVAELGEMLSEFPGWKPWVVKRGQAMNREAFIGEMVDALHFAANILAAVQCSDAELNAAYEAKMEKNRQRMASGTYDGVKDKCSWPGCYRELGKDQRCNIHGFQG